MQLDLFESLRMHRRALQVALERFDRDSAEERLKDVPPETLDWELQALEYLRSHRAADSLDEGFRFWQQLQEEPFFARIPRHSARELRKNYFRRLLTSPSTGTETLRTPQGLSRGYLVLLSGDPREARTLLEEELDCFGESALLRLHLAHANWQCGQQTAARVHFGQALLLGWNRYDAESIPDAELLDCLLDADEPEWAVVQAFIEGVLPLARYPSRADFESSVAFKKRGENSAQAPSDLVARRRQFQRCLVISENRRWVEHDLLTQSRKRMKELHGRLHFLYMRSLESREQSLGNQRRL